MVIKVHVFTNLLLKGPTIDTDDNEFSYELLMVLGHVHVWT